MSLLPERYFRYFTYLKHRLLLHKCLLTLRSVGVNIEPYYFYRESTKAFINDNSGWNSKRWKQYEFFEGHESAIKEIAKFGKNSAKSCQEMLQDLSRGQRCFLIKHHGKTVSSVWVDLSEINFPPLRRGLNSNEGYLFRGETVYEYRGKNIAFYLKSKMNELLLKEGREYLFSYVDYFNHPAIRFKQKTGATKLLTGLSIELWGFKKNWTIINHERRSYEKKSFTPAL